MTTIISKEPLKSIPKRVRHIIPFLRYGSEEELTFVVRQIAAKWRVPEGVEVEREAYGQDGVVLIWKWYETVLEK